jgi:putative ABC transport system permease protein
MAISLRESLHIGLADISTRKVRTIVTVAGIVLGVMCIMVVLAIVNGMNASTIDWMQQRGGLNKIEVQRNWGYDFSRGGDASFTVREVDYLRSQLPPVEAFNPQVSLQDAQIKSGELYFGGNVRGVYPDLQKVEDWPLEQGRFINLDDIEQHRNVIVLGSTVAKELYSSRAPWGRYVELNSHQLMVIGVLRSKYWKNQGSETFGGNALEYMNRRAFVPLSTMLSKIDPTQTVSS